MLVHRCRWDATSDRPLPPTKGSDGGVPRSGAGVEVRCGMNSETLSRFLAAAFCFAALSVMVPVASAQEGSEPRAVIAVADAALAAITRGDMTALTDLMLPEALFFPTGTRDGVPRYRVRTPAEQRASTQPAKVV